MNRFTKKNMVFISVLSASGAVAAILLIFAAIVLFGLLDSMGETKNARARVEKLTRAKPAPGVENEERIKKDIEVYKDAAKGIRKGFSTPLQPAVDAFIKELAAPGTQQMSEDQQERYRVRDPKIDEMDDAQKKKLPMRKLTLDEFKEFYRERFEVECGNYSDQRKDALSTQSFFINNFRKNFSNWQSAVSKFVATARTITAEPIGTTNAVALLLNAMGFVRAVPEEAEFSRLMEDYRSVIEKKAEKGKLGVQAEAANFMLGSSGSQNDNAVNRGYAAADIRDVFFHWDVFGNIVDHLCNGKIKILHNIRVRDFAENPEEGRKLGNFRETVGSYQVYHYTVEVSGSMESIRAFCQSLDQSWKQRRFYVVRAVTLYAEENGAAILMKQDAVAKSENNSGSGEEEVSRGRRRRRRTPQNNSDDANNQQNEEDLRRQEAERIKRMKVHERPGYGAVLIGIGDMYRAFVDFDYVVLDKNQ